MLNEINDSEETDHVYFQLCKSGKKRSSKPKKRRDKPI